MKTSRAYKRDSIHQWSQTIGLAIAMTMAISLVLISGPYLQLLTFAVIDGKSASLYESARGSTVTPYPSLKSWLQEAMWWPYLLCAFLIASVSIFSKSIRQFFTMVSIVSATGLTAIDLGYGVRGAELVQSVFANVIGGLIIASAVYVALALVPILRSLLATSEKSDGVWALMILPLLGLFASAALYYVFKIFLHPLPLDLSLDIRPPFHGYYNQKRIDPLTGCKEVYSTEPRSDCLAEAKDEKARRLANEVDEEFGFLENVGNDYASSVSWLGQATPLRFRWTRKNPESARVVVGIAQGCTDPDDFSRIALEDLGVSTRNSLVMEMGNGMFQVRALNEAGLDNFRVRENGLRQFTVQDDERDNEGFSVSRFISNAQLILRPDTQAADIEVGSFGIHRGAGRLLPRMLTISSDTDQVSMKFHPLTRIRPAAAIECKGRFVKRGGSRILEQLYLSTVFGVTRQDEVDVGSLGISDEVEIESVNGWVRASTGERSRLQQYSSAGDLGLLYIVGTPVSTIVDGVETTTRGRQVIAIYGDLYGAVNGDLLSVVGSTSAMYINSKRFNRTRWEKMDGALRTAVLLAIPTLLLVTWRRLAKIASPERTRWLFDARPRRPIPRRKNRNGRA